MHSGRETTPERSDSDRGRRRRRRRRERRTLSPPSLTQKHTHTLGGVRVGGGNYRRRCRTERRAEGEARPSSVPFRPCGRPAQFIDSCARISSFSLARSVTLLHSTPLNPLSFPSRFRLRHLMPNLSLSLSSFLLFPLFILLINID